jgi:hypothetical protein
MSLKLKESKMFKKDIFNTMMLEMQNKTNKLLLITEQTIITQLSENICVSLSVETPETCLIQTDSKDKKRKPKQTSQCNVILTRGARNGQKCGKPCIDGDPCKVHKNKKQNEAIKRDDDEVIKLLDISYQEVKYKTDGVYVYKNINSDWKEVGLVVAGSVVLC